MQSEQIRAKFLKFFEERGHKIIPSAPLVPENDPSVLFNTAGMQPLVPYLLGATHPAGRRIADIQKCVRTTDIDEVGDNRHLTFFEMMGNWSLGDPSAPDGIGAGYFKKEAITWSWELLINEFGLDPKRLYVTCFEGDENAPRDEESAAIWRGLFSARDINPEGHIFFLPADKNWWSPGDNGPCGPDTEMYYNVGKEDLGDLTLAGFKDVDDEGVVVEIWNDVFMEYEKKDGKVIGKLAQKNVDTGSGFERVVMVLQGASTVFETDLFAPIIDKIKTFAKKAEPMAERIVADHIRTAVFMIADGVTPSNTDRGYVLRRILRRAIRYASKLDLGDSITLLINVIIDKYKEAYPYLETKANEIENVIVDEEKKFKKTLEQGLRKLETHIGNLAIDGVPAKTFLSRQVVFELFTSDGFPIELIEELANERNILIDLEAFKEDMKKHQELSRQGAEQKFKGGLGGNSEQIVKYHTATHLLQRALKDVLGETVTQKGSNITDERLRFDFAWNEKMTPEQIAQVEKIVNEKISEALPVNRVDLPYDEAVKTGATHLFSEKYGDTVSIYFIGQSLDTAYSKEFCGGPHVDNTAELGEFKIAKEEASSAGVRRIKATLN